MKNGAVTLSEEEFKQKANSLLLLAADVGDSARRIVTKSSYLDLKVSSSRLWFSWDPFIKAGREYVENVILGKVVPKSRAAKFNQLSKSFIGQNGTVPDVLKWLEDRERLFDELIPESAEWGSKSENDFLSVDGMEIHNMTTSDISKLVDHIRKANVLIKNSGLWPSKPALYGEVVITNKLAGKRTVAWYSQKEDRVFVVNKLTDFTESYIHEIGHRIWYKFFSGSTKSAWKSKYRFVKDGVSDYKEYKVGEILHDIPIKGRKSTSHVVTDVTPTTLSLRSFDNEHTIGLSRRSVTNLQKTKESFPTMYSAKDEEEYFCECFSLYCVGNLQEPHKGYLESIMTNGSKTAAGTYANITRQELEEWMDDLPSVGRWQLRPNSVGTYWIPLSDMVAVRLSSTIGQNGDAIGRGEASMQLALVSRITSKVINKVSQGQSHFARTKNWRANWKTGFERMKDSYTKSMGFYDTIAQIKDRKLYEREMLKKIEDVSGWQSHPILLDFHKTIERGGVLVSNQQKLLEKISEERKPSVGKSETEDKIRLIINHAVKTRNQWLTEFSESVLRRVQNGGTLSDKQIAVLNRYWDEIQG